MYKTSAVYNAFVCHKKTLGTKLEVCLGGEEVIVPLHRSSAARWTWSGKHLDAPGFSFHRKERRSSVRKYQEIQTVFPQSGLDLQDCFQRLTGVMMSGSRDQRWPMGIAGSVRLGWNARCMDWGSVMAADAFSSSLLRRHAALGFRFLSVG